MSSSLKLNPETRLTDARQLLLQISIVTIVQNSYEKKLLVQNY